MKKHFFIQKYICHNLYTGVITHKIHITTRLFSFSIPFKWCQTKAIPEPKPEFPL